MFQVQGAPTIQWADLDTQVVPRVQGGLHADVSRHPTQEKDSAE